MYQTLKTSGVSTNPNIQQPSEIQVGNGVVPVAYHRSFARRRAADQQPA